MISEFRNWHRIACGAIACLVTHASAHAADAPQSSQATIDVAADVHGVRVWPEIMGINLDYGGAAALAKTEAMQAVKRIGIKSIRFPNGCEADRYDWKADNRSKMSVDQFLAFCDAVGAEPYYTLNLQGGTEGRQGPPPAGAPLQEVIRYRHIAPNPCGYTDYYFGTLADAVEIVRKHTIERALAGRRPILCYEMGNENWGQGRTDWPPEVYAATVAAYARAMRGALADAAREHAPLKDLKLWITAVGYPLVGNNQDPTQATDRDVNVRWTREVNALYDAGLIDAVQDHFYPYSTEGADLLVWSYHNLQNILFARRGLANPLLNSYRDDAIAYRMPIEITEWNLKCWGEQRRTDIPARNLGFDQGLAGWKVNAKGGTRAEANQAAGRRGPGLRLTTQDNARQSVLVHQVFDWKDKKTKRIFATAWVRTDKPASLTASLRTVTAGDELGPPLAETGQRRAWRAGHWHKLCFGGAVPDGTTQLAVAFELTGPDARADIDGVELFYWNAEGGLAPASVDTAAQQLFLVDAIRTMIEHGVRRAHLHHLFGGYPCGIMLPDGRIKDNYKVFEFYAGRIGTRVVQTTMRCDTFDFECQAARYATDFNALAPSAKQVPVISALAMRDDRAVYVVAVNRSTDLPVEATIRIRGADATGPASERSLTCTDLDAPGVKLSSRDLPCGPERKRRLAPHSAYIFRFGLAGEKR